MQRRQLGTDIPAAGRVELGKVIWTSSILAEMSLRRPMVPVCEMSSVNEQCE